MIAAGPILADLFLSVAAILGLASLDRVIAGRGAEDPLNRRFLTGIRITILLFAGRALAILTGMGMFRVVVLIAAALVPVAVLILTEGLLRRHAPRRIKGFIAVGAGVFVFLAIVPLGNDWWRLIGLLCFQVGALLACGWLVLRRDRASLSWSENRAVERLGLSLILLVPLAAVDFLTVQLGVPIQVSPLAVLFLCWLAIGLGRTETRHVASLLDVGVTVVAALAAAGLVVVIWGLDFAGGVVAGAVILAAAMVATVTIEARQSRLATQGLSLLRRLAEGGEDADAFLAGLRGHPAIEGAVVIDGAAFDGLDADVLDRLFAAHPVLRRGDVVADAEGDHAAHLFARYEASHLMCLARTPLRLVALSMPSVAASSATELELRVVQRMAMLMGRTDHGS